MPIIGSTTGTTHTTSVTAGVRLYTTSEELVVAADKLLEQFKNKPKWRAFIYSWLRPFEELRYQALRVRVELQLGNAEGDRLDMWGRILLQPRLGLDDEIYRRLLEARLAAKLSKGRSEDLIKVSRLYSPNAGSVYISPAVAGAAYVVVEVVIGADADVVDPHILYDLLTDAKAGGVRLTLVYSTHLEDNTFAFSDFVSDQTVDVNRGWGDLSQTQGGYWAGVIQ